jgi:hypothetical protein
MDPVAVNNPTPAENNREVIAELQGQINHLRMELNHQRTNANSNPFAPPKVKTVSARLPAFDGKNDPEIWISKIETILQGRNYPEERWTMHERRS